MAKKIQQYYIAKIDANKVVAENYELHYTLKEARINEEIVSVGDSQVLRVIRKLVNRETDYEDLDFLIREKSRLKRKIKKYNEEENKKKLFEVLRKIDEYLYIPEYVSIVSENKTQYEKIAKRRKGFWINGYRYKRFMCSAGNARTNTAFFLREDLFKPLVKILQNGHHEVDIAEAKYNAYFSLASSATYLVSTPKVVVVPDCELKRNEIIDRVDLVAEEYSIAEKEVPVDFNLWDGMGIISPLQAKRWADELELDYIPSGFLIRAPFVKGMVFVFDFHKFAYEVAGKRYIKDVYGIEHHVDDVEVILTQSQFKLWKGWNSWEEYERCLVKNELSWGVTKYPPKFEKDFIRTNYQFVQVLNLDDEGIGKLCEPTAKWLEGVVGGDVNYVKLYLLGKLADTDNVTEIWNDLQNNFLKGLLINDEIKNDKYIQNKINQSIQKKIKESYIGKLIIDGNFQVMINDPYALCEWIFDMEVKGLLKRKEYYSNYWNKKGIKKVIGMRSPLTWRSEVNDMPLVDNEQMEEWYKYLDSGIVYNVHGYDGYIHAGSDVDGDIVCTTSNEEFINGMYGGIPVLGDHNSPKKTKINEKNVTKLYKFDGKAFNTKIGFITNCSTTMYEMLKLYKPGTKEYNEIINRLKLCCHFQSLQIDSAKGIVVQSMPKSWTKWQRIPEDATEKEKEKIQFENSLLIEKRPYFMRYLYGNYNMEYKNYIDKYNNISLINFGCSFENPTEEVKNSEEYRKLKNNFNKYNKFLMTDGVMNKVCHYMEGRCKDIKFNLKNINDTNYVKLYMDNTIELDNDKLKLMVEKYDEYSKRKNRKNKINDDGMSFEKYCSNLKDEIYDISINERELANLAVYVAYILNQNKPKDFAWDICGDGIVRNIMNNTEGNIIKIPRLDNNGNINYLGKKYKIENREVEVDYDIV